MGQTAAGAIKILAEKTGLLESTFRALVASGLKWCYGCREWYPRGTAFCLDRCRYDGVSPLCRACRTKRNHERYVPSTKPKPKPGRRYVAARPGDKKQARRRVNHLIAVGLLPRPSTLACVDCGHRGPKPRHEYDHFLGYDAAHHEHVQAVCARCQRRRALERGEWVIPRRSAGRFSRTGH